MIRIVAKKFEFMPGEITLEKGVPVVLELTTEDVAMGFSAPDFKADVEIVPGKAGPACGWCPTRRAPSTSSATCSAATGTRTWAARSMSPEPRRGG